MEPFAIYLIKSAVWLTGFFLIYILFLRNERFFVLNRAFLVSGILSSIVFPLFTWHYTVVFPVTPTAEVLEPQIQGVTAVRESFPVQTLLLYIYLSGAIFLIFRMLKQTFSVVKVIRKSERYHFNSVKLIRTDRYPASFSFFSFVFVNPSTDEPETNEIVNHEQEHIRQQHWIDLLLFEILHTMHWFNPVSWLYGRLIRQNHEYLADERALQRSSNPAIYRAALLNQMFGAPVISLANSFNYSLNKKRFNMMKQITYSPVRKLKLLLVLPLIAGVFYAFATPEYKFLRAEGNTEAVNLPQNTKTVKGKVITEDGTPLRGTSIVVSGSTIGTMPDENGNFKLEVPDDSPIVFSFVGYQSVKVKPDFEKEMVITMKKATIGINLNNRKAETPAKTSGLENYDGEALLFLDGKEISKPEMGKVKPDDIESVKVLKGEQAISKYGDKGKKGVIEITLKKKGTSVSGNNTSKVKVTEYVKEQTNKSATSPIEGKRNEWNNVSGHYFKERPLIVKDGVVSPELKMNDINQNSIESIKVLKDEMAITKYGTKGQNGVVEITTRKGSSASKNKPLIVIDGAIAVNQDMDKIDPETIESVSALTNESAIALYGEKGKNGVVSITLKKPKEVFVVVEEMPEFPGGIEALRTFVADNLQYPKIALENRIQGQVKVKFVVGATGSIQDVKLSSGVDPSLDKEAIRLVESMPKWKPGSQRGQNVEVAYEMPINFTYPADYHPKDREKLKEKK
jgi:TonB family protein